MNEDVKDFVRRNLERDRPAPPPPPSQPEPPQRRLYNVLVVAAFGFFGMSAGLSIPAYIDDIFITTILAFAALGLAILFNYLSNHI